MSVANLSRIHVNNIIQTCLLFGTANHKKSSSPGYKVFNVEQCIKVRDVDDMNFKITKPVQSGNNNFQKSFIKPTKANTGANKRYYKVDVR